jgi:diguanylate cyclase (GGDEF)-like protein
VSSSLSEARKDSMRRLALLGLVVSLLLGAVTASVTLGVVNARRNDQDRSLQAAASGEISLISGGERETSAALSLLLVNPAVREVLGGGQPAAALRHTALANTAGALAAIRRTAFLPLSAACLNDSAGRELACAAAGRRVSFSRGLRQQFLALAGRSTLAAVSGTFVSPVDGQLSVAFLAPFRAGGQLRGFVHLDIGIANIQGGSLIKNSTPGVSVQLASYDNGRLVFNGPSASLTVNGLESPPERSGAGFAAEPRPVAIFAAGHRAMVAVLPLTIGAAHLRVAVAAIATSSNPDFFNAWSPGMLVVLAVVCLMLMSSIAGLATSSRRLSRELSTDPLTGLGNRRALMDDLARVCQGASEGDPAFLWYFDLNGFKRYNDSFGHVAGDTLLARLGSRLREAVQPAGVSYRLGGDEFCVLIPGALSDPHALFQKARKALAETGGGFGVSASGGAVEIPREARDPTQALRLADQRMYSQKGATQAGASELITAALHTALAQRHPDLGEHADDVVSDVERLALAAGLDEQEVKVIAKAGDLHDVGKVGIPDAIITKAGPLTSQEWKFMHQHTVMGEQILMAAGPSMAPLAPLVRASHERWDGNGYPDGLAGEEIPVGARIIAICDSFSAMMTDRVYKPAMSMSDALTELRRCAGTQFDPHLIDLFCSPFAINTERGRHGSAGHNNGRRPERGATSQHALSGGGRQPDRDSDR